MPCMTMSTPGVGNTTCERRLIQCPPLASIHVELWITTPTTPQIVGTVVLGTGSGGDTWYEECPEAVTYPKEKSAGLQVVEGLVARGYRVIQRRWERPWAQKLGDPASGHQHKEAVLPICNAAEVDQHQPQPDHSEHASLRRRHFLGG